MRKIDKKKEKAAGKTTKVRKKAKEQTRAAENVGYLIELHKLQGALLAQLRKEIVR